MSYVIAVPDMLTAAAADVAGIGSSLSEANRAAAASTTDVIAAGGDEVSAAVASLFSSRGKAFQALSTQAAEFHSRFVQALNTGARAYASTEAASTASLPVPNIAISVSGVTVLQSGSATAYSFLGDSAIAIGANSYAQADEGTFSFFNHAFAIGNNSTALAVWGSGDTAIAFGAKSEAIANGNLEFASAVGTNSSADTGEGPLAFSAAFGTNSMASTDYAQLSMSCAVGGHSVADVDNGSLDTAVALGAHSTAGAQNGNLDFAAVLGTGSTASAGGTTIYPAVPGDYNVALVLGTDSTADAGASHTTTGNGNLAVAVGNMLDAAATGANGLVDVVF
jgi:hypothetical protein